MGGEETPEINKSKSIVQLKQEVRDYKLRRRRAAEEMGRLSDFVRLVDYITVQNLLKLLLLVYLLHLGKPFLLQALLQIHLMFRL